MVNKIIGDFEVSSILRTVVHILLTILMLNSIIALVHSSSHEHVFCVEHQALEESGHESSEAHNLAGHGNLTSSEGKNKHADVVASQPDEDEANHSICYLEHWLKSEVSRIFLNFDLAQLSQGENSVALITFFTVDVLQNAPKASPPLYSLT